MIEIPEHAQIELAQGQNLLVVTAEFDLTPAGEIVRFEYDRSGRARSMDDWYGLLPVGRELLSELGESAQAPDASAFKAVVAHDRVAFVSLRSERLPEAALATMVDRLSAGLFRANVTVTEASALLAPCHPEATIGSALADGVLVGTCMDCLTMVVRINPKTGVEEWLDGRSPWTEGDLRPTGR